MFGFLTGIMAGGCLGVVLMCLFQINRTEGGKKD